MVGIAWFNRIKIILLLAWLQIPHVAANHAVIWAQGPALPTGPREKLPPNIVVILADDLGYNDIRTHGGGVVPTPNIDAIAQGGVDFLNGYAGDATCAPNFNIDPTEKNNLSVSEPEQLKTLSATMEKINSEQVRPLWPSVLSGAIAIDHPGGIKMQPQDVFIYWDN